MKSYWEQRYDSEEAETAASVISDPAQINRKAKLRFADIVLREIETLDTEISTAKILSVGSGTGLVSERIAKQADLLFGIDFSATAIGDLTSKPHSGQYAVAAANLIPCDEPFDIVTAFSVLYHIVNDENWQKSISELARLTKPGGYLMCRINWNNEAIGSQTDSHFYSRHCEAYKREFRQNSLVIKDVVDLPVQPQGFQFLSQIPASAFFKKLISPVILLAGLWKNHQNKLIILQKE